MIDDDPEAVRQVQAFLDPEVYSIDSEGDPIEGVNKARSSQPALIILDIKMDPLDGFGVIRRLQQQQKTKYIPIIIFSIIGDKDETILRGLGLGAEHIVFKGRQKSMQILELTIEKQLQKRRGPSVELFHVGNHELKVADNAGRVWIDDVEVSLTLCQQRILYRLIEAAGSFLSTDELITLIGKDCRGDDYIIARPGYAYKFIHDLRGQIEPDPVEPIFILSQRDLGYRINPDCFQ
ncbi:MAG: response regulator [Candidatus Promineifilaceae bacterium]